MVRVTGLGAGYAAPRRAGRSIGFALPDAPEPTGAAPVPGASAPSLLALQEVRPDTEAARRRAGRALDELRELQLALLAGAADPARLARLADLASAEPVADPGLHAILREIALRARVELARFRALSASQA